MIDVGQAKLVAEREVREQLRGKPVWIATTVAVLAVVLAIVLPHVLAGGPSTYRIAVTGNPAPALRAAITAATEGAGARARIVTVPDRASAVDALRGQGDAHADLAVDTSGAGSVIVDRAFEAGSTQTKALVAQGIARAVAVQHALDAADLTPAQAIALTHPEPVAIDHLRPAPTSSAHRVLALGGAIVFFMLVMWFGTGLLTGVVHEKSTRVVEVVLSSVRATELLTGKILGASLIVLVQAVLLVAAALISANAVGSNVLAGNGAGSVLVAGLWVVLGFVLYAALFAAAGSLASRVEDAQSVGLPLQVPLLIGYLISFTGLGSDSGSTLLRIFAYVPFTAPMNMPVLAATGGASGWQVALSMLITVAAIVVTMRAASLVFDRSILRVGSRVRLRSLFVARDTDA